MTRFASARSGSSRAALALALAAAVVSGCGSPTTGTETGNPGEVAARTMPIISSSDVARIGTLPEHAPTELLVTDALLRTSSVRFILCDQSEIVFDALELTSSTGQAVMLPAGRYCSAEVTFAPAADPASIFELLGIRTADGVDYSIESHLEGRSVLAPPARDGTTAAPTSIDIVASRGYFLVLDVARVLPAEDGIVAQTPLASSGGARIDEQVSPALSSRVAENIRLAFVLVEDADASGTLEPTELDVPLFVSQ